MSGGRDDRFDPVWALTDEGAKARRVVRIRIGNSFSYKAVLNVVAVIFTMPPRVKSTRSSPNNWLIGSETPTITCRKRLPTLRHVLQFVLHLHKTENIRDACRLAVEEIIPIWTAGIGTDALMEVKNATTKLQNIFKEWIELKRSMYRKTNLRREAFIESLDKLFDIARSDAIEIIKEQEDRDFYLSMKEDRAAYMSCVDKKWVKKLNSKMKKNQSQSLRKRRSDEEVKRLLAKTSSAAVPVEEPTDASESENEEDKGKYQ